MWICRLLDDALLWGLQVAVDVDAVKWSMCHDRTPFFASALSSLKLAMTRNEDNSGERLSCGSPAKLGDGRRRQ